MNIEESLKLIPKRLETIEEVLKLNKTGMAQKIGVSRSFYSNIVTGAQLPSFSFLVSLCDNCGISADWIIFGTGQMFKNDNEVLSEIDQDWIEIIRFINKFDPDTQLDYIEHMKTGAKLIINSRKEKKE